MSKRTKDPKGDLRFVCKSAQTSDFRPISLTAMSSRQARRLQAESRYALF
jgi:hypothetical protein